ncbi:hypothetical protein GCM10010123_24580 [Pilimelia anulata]|uniref:Uncharacterized protein n=1 Tax=Pilimelia anulata TaxID=53371 RepID=A0A8J3F9P9_9ACTN|nr:hypothetical protein GCM10010123_24580 [Pilimelia anulata]
MAKNARFDFISNVSCYLLVARIGLGEPLMGRHLPPFRLGVTPFERISDLTDAPLGSLRVQVSWLI